MPNYHGHLAINSLGLAAGVALLTQYAPLPLDRLALGIGSFIVATLFLSPDLDLAYSNPSKNWGLLKILWWPYSFFSKHRGLSHSLVFSSALRVSYLIVIMALFYIGWLAATGDFAQASSLFSRKGTETDLHILVAKVTQRHLSLMTVGAGIWYSDLCHILADRLFTAWKRL